MKKVSALVIDAKEPLALNENVDALNCLHYKMQIQQYIWKICQ